MTWREQAACKGMDAELSDRIFFPTPRNGRPPDYRDAARYCGGCVAREECLADALHLERAAGSRYGFRGGMSADQRAQLVVKR